jgi:uncharacterized protein YecE (DUF72 family)
MGDIVIGCAGWSVPAQHRQLFGDGESVLARYATRFPAVEINSSFYRSHRRSTYERWAASVPSDFRFSVKMPKAISHEAALRGTGDALDRFLDEATGLGDKLAGVLLQLPPSQPFEPRAASTFFRMFRRRSALPIACEARHASWFSPAATALLQRNGVSRVTADPAIKGSDAQAAVEQAWPYWRLHGKPRVYYSPYPDDALEDIAAVVSRTHGASRPPWVMFDNTAHGFAARDAARLQDLLGRRARRA